MIETTSQHQHVGNAADAEYDAYLARVRARFGANTNLGPVFTTSVPPAALWEKYLTSFPEDQQQHHNCNACRHFIQRFGGLVVIDADGATKPAMWDVADAYGPYVLGVERMANLVKNAKVTGVFVSGEQILGYPQTGVWRHLHAHMANVHRDRTKEPHQAAAEKLQDYGTLRRGLDEFDRATVVQAIQLLESNSLYRSERVLGAAKWLLEVHDAREGKVGAQQANVTWRAVATAPAGFCQPRSSMIGTLLEDIAAGLPVADIQRRFADKMDPAQYQRAQAAPKAGQIDAAERAVEALGIAPAFARRYAVVADMRGVLWTPSEVAAHPQTTAIKGVFADMKAAPAAAAALDIPAKKMTWEKFTRDVLPGAAVIEYRVPLVGPFCALTAAQDLSAPPILQWDDAGPAEDPMGQRNTVSWSFPSPPARADEWSLQAGATARVRMIVQSPNLWNGGESRFAHHGKGAFLLLEGAHDSRGQPGGGLFSEHLRSELKPYRSTIEAHMNRLMVAGADDPNAAGFGIGLFDGGEFAETAAPKIQAGAPAGGPAPKRIHVILMVDDSGSMQSYIGAARSALASLLGAVRAMPGEVDVSVVKFGSRAALLCDRAPLSATESIERQITGGSGGTALNDALGDAINRALSWHDAGLPDTSFFLGIVTDGEENESRRFGHGHLHRLLAQVNATGRWTVAYAGAGRDPRQYARLIGIPDGNTTVFEASARGFEDAGRLYASSTRSLASSYASGARASTSFFAAAPSRQALGKDHPVLLVTNKSGGRMAYELDRWE